MTNRAELKAWLNNPASGSGVYGRDWTNLCQALMWRVIDAFGSPVNPTSYSSAQVAANNSSPLNGNLAAAPAGAFHYWRLGTPGHVGLDMEGGGTNVLMATGRAVGTDWGHHVREASVVDYNATGGVVYLGWSMHNGTSTIAVTPDSTLTQQQRKSLPTGKVNRRTGPGKAYPEVVPENDLPANTIGNFVAFAHGPASKGQPAGNDVWYQGVSGDWFWAGAFTTTDGAGLKDLTAQFADVVVPPITLPTFQVTFDSVGGSPLFPLQMVTALNPAVKPEADPSKDGFKFLGWTVDGTTIFNFATGINQDTVIKAEFDLIVVSPPVVDPPVVTPPPVVVPPTPVDPPVVTPPASTSPFKTAGWVALIAALTTGFGALIAWLSTLGH